MCDVCSSHHLHNVPGKVLAALRTAHTNGEANAGVDVDGDSIGDKTGEGVVDLMSTKESALRLAVDAAVTVLRVRAERVLASFFLLYSALASFFWFIFSFFIPSCFCLFVRVFLTSLLFLVIFFLLFLHKKLAFFCFLFFLVFLFFAFWVSLGLLLVPPPPPPVFVDWMRLSCILGV